MTKQAFIFLFLFLFMGVAWTGCYGCFGSSDDESTVVVDDDDDDGDDDDDDGDDDDDDGDEAPESLADAFAKAGEAIEEALGGAGSTVKEAVDFRKLKDLLPEKVDGLERTSFEGERTGALGMQLSNAQARYEDGDERIEIRITDLGTLTGIARIGYTAWLQTEIDRESDRGFERTHKFRSGGKEYPSFEKFEGTGDEGNCEIQVWVAERFIVSVQGRNVEMGQCEDARDEISFRQLDRMKDVGTED